ncbi:hypothetical protein HIM_07029 [Hirsutella minnesotensis 3608]|uniref:Carrier domain-containing protein n=1 Tax=Hirsutella minnesotensis 3608 TaxID=1043627 RepID=A0A0F7ZTP5_9HYPO|nr:hypothetical protein HIM_07029 [Hirsutella minnesotensis 3608]
MADVDYQLDILQCSDLAIYDSQLTSPRRTLLDILDATTLAFPHEIALSDNVESLTYTELNLRIATKCQRLQSNGIGPGDRVGIRLSSGSVALYVTILSVLASGAAYVPVDVDDPDERADVVWTESGACAVLGDEESLVVRCPPKCQRRRPVPEDDAWIIFTSGSTGKPKGVAVTHGSAAAFVDAEADLFTAIGPGDRVLAGLSVAFDASCEEMWLAWRHAACLVPAPRSLVRAGVELGGFLADQHITVVSTVPTLASSWPLEALAHVRLLILGGEACSPTLAARLDNGHRELWNTYGPTEATVVSCAARLEANELVRIGLPLKGWKLAVIDANGRPVRWGESGELIIGGVGLGRYLDSSLDAVRMAPLPSLGWARAYRSGDIVRAERQGLVFVGRDDEQIKLGGRRLELGEIDAVLMELPGVHAAASAVRRSEMGNPLLIGYIVRQLEPREEDRDILRARLPAALIPALVTIDSIPLRTSGKADRKALPWPLPQKKATTTPTGTAGWLGEQWRRVLGITPTNTTSNFFDLGGSSLAAAQLASRLRRQCPALSVADLYRHPTLEAMAARIEILGATGPSTRVVVPTPRSAGLVQFAIMLGLFTLEGLRWLLSIALINKLAALALGPLGWAVPLSWPQVLAGWLLLASLPGRIIIAGASARLLTTGIVPGRYPRGGSAHLRLWTAQRLVAMSALDAIAGTHWCRGFAMMLGCRVGADAQLHALPPLTGLASFGARCVVEPEADVDGWWLDGDVLHVGSVTIGNGARIGTRATLMPDTVVAPFASVEPGTAASGTVTTADMTPGLNAQPEGFATRMRYTMSLLVFELLTSLSAAPALILSLIVLDRQDGFQELLIGILGLAIPATAASILCYAGIVVALVHFASNFLVRGVHSWHGTEAWAAWFTTKLVTHSRVALFPLFASLLTPAWFRALGARVGRHVEASTVLAIPSLMNVGDGAFLADDVLLAPYQLLDGQIRIGPATVDKRGFVGNSAIVGPEDAVPSESLIGVLATAPPPTEITPGSSWLGRPAIDLPRKAKPGDPRRTFDPPTHLVLARAIIESWRLLPLVCSSLLAEFVTLALATTMASFGFVGAALIGGFTLLFAGIIACAVASGAKYLLTGAIDRGEHPLWSCFVWRNELADSFIESLAVPWLARMSYGTPLLCAWLRLVGADIGPGVWCETHRLPEANLVHLGAGATVNRGCVLQTHLFHDRIMRLDALRLQPGATLGPHSIALPGAVIGTGTTVGAASLVMRAEQVPDGTRWMGNPIQPWRTEEGERVWRNPDQHV